MGSTPVFVALGSNLGDRLGFLTRAVAEMQERGLHVRAESDVYETEPVGGPGQGPYLNAVVRAETELPPGEVLRLLLAIERDLGRVRGRRNAARVIDLDLLLYGDLVLDAPGLALPHPRLHERRFVLQPLVDVAAEVTHPRLGRTMADLLARSADRAAVRRWGRLPDPGA